MVQTNSAVAIQGYIFSSVTDIQSWLRNNVRDSAAYVLFVDLHSFLAIIAADQASNDSLAFTKALRDAKKAGFDTVWEAAILGSFNSGLPSVFGQRSKSVASKFDTRDLPRLPTFDQFRDLSDPSGFALWFLNQIEQTRGSLRHQAEIKLTGHALKVSMEMICEAATAASELTFWMWQQYKEHTEHQVEPADAWCLVLQAVRSMFEDLHTERQAGCMLGFASVNFQARIVWGCLRGHQRLVKMRRNHFTHDIAAQRPLAKFLIGRVLLQSEFDEFKKECKLETDDGMIRTELDGLVQNQE